MRVEWMQVAMEVVEQSAPDLAVMLDTTEAEAGWGLIKLFKWALGRVPQGEYPSRHDLVPGAKAAQLIARAAGFMGSAELYCDSLAELAHPILQRLPDGIRFRGMKRYDVILDSEVTRSAKAKKAADARWAAVRQLEHAPSIGQASTEHEPSNAPRCLDGDQDGDGDVEKKTDESEKEKPPPPTPSDGHGAHRFPTGSPQQPTDRPRAQWERPTGALDDDVTWKALQACRAANDRARELLRPPGFVPWLATASAAGFSLTELVEAYRLYLRDGTIRAAGHPTAVFITGDVWRVRTRVPMARAH